MSKTQGWACAVPTRQLSVGIVHVSLLRHCVPGKCLHMAGAQHLAERTGSPRLGVVGGRAPRLCPTRDELPVSSTCPFQGSPAPRWCTEAVQGGRTRVLMEGLRGASVRVDGGRRVHPGGGGRPGASRPPATTGGPLPPCGCGGRMHPERPGPDTLSHYWCRVAFSTQASQ